MSFSSAMVAIVIGMLSSTGLWSYLQRRAERKAEQLKEESVTEKATTRLLLGIAHDRIIWLGMAFKERGYITKDEYEDFFFYLCDPYSTFGGNGLAEKIIDDVKKLPIINHPQNSKPKHKEEPDERRDQSVAPHRQDV